MKVETAVPFQRNDFAIFQHDHAICITADRIFFRGDKQLAVTKAE
jgi:hypothetical protein